MHYLGRSRRARSRAGARRLTGVIAALLASFASPAAGQLTSFVGGPAAQADWRSAVDSFVVEDFESRATDSPVTSLPQLGLVFAPLPSGAQPGIYSHGSDDTSFGSKQLANFPGNCCIDTANQFGDVIATVDPLAELRAFAFWNGDPQGAVELRVFDRSNALLGTVTAGVNTGIGSDSFAGFVSSVPVGRLEFEGSQGDGWNHWDGFQASVTTPVPSLSATARMLVLSLSLIAGARGRAWTAGRSESMRVDG